MRNDKKYEEGYLAEKFIVYYRVKFYRLYNNLLYNHYLCFKN